MTAPITFTLPMPPSVNAAYANAPGIGRVKTKALKAWLAEAGWAVKLQLPAIRNGTIFPGPVAVSYELERTNKRRDLANCEKACGDLLTKLRVWTDDSQIHELHMRWAPITGCRITVSEMAE